MPARALAKGDFDEDGVPDLLVAHTGADGRGAIAIHRGNIDAIYPNQPEAKERRAKGTFTDAPFLRSVSVFDAGEAIDFVGAGDFDADGHWDAVTARRGGRTLYWQRGDGKGALGAAQKIELPGALTAFVVGEVNRRDGLDDVVVAVEGAGGARLVVFEGPRGALVDPPEEIPVTGKVSTIAVGHVDDDYTNDLVVGAGSNLHVVRGRDRRLSLDGTKRAAVRPADVTTVALPFTITSLALGEFDDASGRDIALCDASRRVSVVGAREILDDPRSVLARLSPSAVAGPAGAAGAPEGARLVRAKVSGRGGDDLLILDGDASGVLSRAPVDPAGNRRLEVAHALGPIVDVVGMRLGPEALDSLVEAVDGDPAPTITRPGPFSTYSVSTTNDFGPGSLRQAIIDANAATDIDVIRFDIPGPAPHVIQPLDGLPVIAYPVIIDGTTNPDFAGSPVIVIDGSMAGIFSGLEVWGGASIVRGLVINQFPNTGFSLASGIALNHGEDDIVEGNFLGTDWTGAAPGPGQWAGVGVYSAHHTIGGTTPAARNVIAGNFDAVRMQVGANGTIVRGNYVDLNASGTASIFASNGIAASNFLAPGPLIADLVIGGTVAGSGNVVAGDWDVNLDHTTGALVQGNRIGTDPAGMIVLHALGHGVWLSNSSGATVGGTTPSARNIVGGQSVGISVGPGGAGGVATGNLIQGNHVGVAADGFSPIPNQIGVRIDGGPNNVVGGFVPAARNIVSGNTSRGIYLIGSIGGNDVLGNWIGITASGSVALPNATGVHVEDSPGNRIGGSTIEAANVISGNTEGVAITGAASSGNVVEVNLIGTNSTGTLPLGNSYAGVILTDAPSNFVGIKQGQGNIISANEVGVVIRGAGATSNRIQGNRIGTDLTGTSMVGSAAAGIQVSFGAAGNVIGGPGLEIGNLISGGGEGVTVFPTVGPGNLIIGNLIGTDLAGTTAFPNLIGIDAAGPGTLIGDGVLSHRNVISGNLQEGIWYGSFGVVDGNFIGTRIDGTLPLGNGGCGIRVDPGVPLAGEHAVVGRATPSSAGNVIANNGTAGIVVTPGSMAAQLSGNSIHDNGGLGIDLGEDGVTPNDLDDPDTGPNMAQNYPVLTITNTSGGDVELRGFLDGTPSTGPFTIDFYSSPTCDSSGNGEGQTWLGSTTTSTPASSLNAVFLGTFTVDVADGEAITATATSPDHDTSEFSACRGAVGVPPGPIAGLAIAAGQAESVSWQPVPGATSYHIYVGTRATQGALATQAFDSCEAVTLQGTSFNIPPAGNPPVGEMFWIQVTAEGQYGEGAAGPGDPGPEILNSTGTCTTSCAHDPCAPGAALEPACSLSASLVCEKDSACCDPGKTGWTGSCVKEVRTLAGSLLCPEAQGQCAHGVCDDSGPLTPGCDVPPLAVSCTAAICAVDPKCCQQAWNQACIAKVASVCHASCI
ncbi:MAG TPA: hypothetical protein VJV75_07335 [Candidatus Polarisedimenticolia bacterium]|nr:hypothetical protein [Candidatus Polarisedimenticolia bacterium]